VLQCEYDMTHDTYRMQKDLAEEFSKRPPNTAALFAIMQVSTYVTVWVYFAARWGRGQDLTSPCRWARVILKGHISDVTMGYLDG